MKIQTIPERLSVVVDDTPVTVIKYGLSIVDTNGNKQDRNLCSCYISNNFPNDIAIIKNHYTNQYEINGLPDTKLFSSLEDAIRVIFRSEEQ